MAAKTADSDRLFPLRITAAEMEAYRLFLIALATVVTVDNPLYLDAAEIIDRLEDFADNGRAD